MAEQKFTTVQRELEETLSKLKGETDPKTRRLLLREMRRLLAEAERSADSPK
jgi:hypothetical protein